MNVAHRSDSKLTESSLVTRIHKSRVVPEGKVGFLLPTFFAEGNPVGAGKNISTFSKLAEDAGASALWVLDHSLWSIPTLDPLGSLFCAAGATKNMLVGTSVLQLPLRSEIIVAKQMATLEALFDRTPILGVGIGNHKTEFEKLGIDFRSRSEKFIGQLENLIKLRDASIEMHSQEPTHSNRYQFSPAFNSPLWIGGRGSRSLEWTALFGDGWLPHLVNQDKYCSLLRELNEVVEKLGKNTAEIKKGIIMFGNIATSRSEVDDSVSWVSRISGIDREKIGKYVFTGSPEQFCDYIKSWIDLGVDHAIIGITSNTPIKTLEALMNEYGNSSKELRTIQ